MSEGLAPSRGAAALILAVGLAIGLFTEWQLQTWGTYYPKLMALIPLFVVMGVAGLVEPKIVNPWHSVYAEEPGTGTYKVVAIVLMTAGMGLGVYVALALMLDLWLPRFLIEHFARQA